jgi:hypothetical protein
MNDDDEIKKLRKQKNRVRYREGEKRAKSVPLNRKRDLNLSFLARNIFWKSRIVRHHHFPLFMAKPSLVTILAKANERLLILTKFDNKSQ